MPAGVSKSLTSSASGVTPLIPIIFGLFTSLIKATSANVNDESDRELPTLVSL